uniref:Uncharacterized protein n=1 Tax=Caenorhabditis japonica TaxID=281687 RepID=A0A8R1EWL5_CAEJA
MNGAVVHHVVVVPLEPQEIIIKDVIVDYTDAKSKDLKRVSASPLVRGYDHFLSEKALKDVLGVHPRHFLIFAAIALPLTVTSALFYSRSVSRYPIKKRQ